jgi:hypothetical protein
MPPLLLHFSSLADFSETDLRQKRVSFSETAPPLKCVRSVKTAPDASVPTYRLCWL